MRILVTGAGGPAGINVIKLLKEYGYYIVSTDINEYSEGFVLSDSYYVIPPAYEMEKFIQTLEEVIEKENIDFVIPTVDEEIEVMAERGLKYREKFILHPKETVKVCLDKLKTYKHFEDKVPELVPEYSEDPRAMRSEKVVKKPVKGRGSRGVYTGDREEFKREEGYFYVEYLPGTEWTVDAVADKDGKLVVAVPRVRLKTRSGVTVVGRVKVDEKILGYVKKVTSYLKFTGGFNVQFREDLYGNPKLQEINIRFSGGLDITDAAGVNLPKLVIDIWEGNKVGGFKVNEGIYVRVPQVYYWK
ncbi:ATP-grasp domain-containing protein [Stygiolobus caldivivus]|uniref:Carbamoyl phosphate synthase n=1 Tax=Stygiolobus caldivivus TaxID=2824673 RepID=A0A8D5ZF12_9CREN|nr:ATP-grasp domain-containing protein [Stygiolobus caldivivus]BCU69988.1 carbamoyl phosphate synthase [Stygiolobus caldivivus]